MSWQNELSKVGYNLLSNPSTRRRLCGCYVATAVYGSYDCPEVWTLRRFRDQKLKSTRRGRAFIRLYYAFSPAAVALFGKSRLFRAFWKPRLDRLTARLQEKGYSPAPYRDE
jgi:hypothetical protein